MFEFILYRVERFISIAKLKLSRRQFILLSSVLVATSASMAAILLKIFVHFIFQFVTHNKVSNYRFFYLLLPFFGILITVIIVKQFFGGKLKKGLSQIHLSIGKKKSFLPFRNVFDQFFTSSITVGFGGSTGLEAPIVVTGAAIGSNFARRYHLSYNERTLLLACGISAGIASAFNAPIAGVLFALEVLLVDISISAFTPLIIAGATGTLLSKIILKEGILLNFKLSQSFNYLNVPFYIILGVLSGLIAVYHSRYFTKIEQSLSQGIRSDIFRIFISGLFLAGLIAVFPSLFGEGYESIRHLAEQNPLILFNNSIIKNWATNEVVVIVLVGSLVFLKTLATAITIGGGGNGGNFAPSLFIGAYLGFFVSRMTNFLKIANLPVSNFTLVGMAGILSGIYHAPLTSIFLIAEITNGYALMIPLMIVASISFAISRAFERYSIDTKNLVKKGELQLTNKDYSILNSISLKDVIEKDYLILNPYLSLNDFFKLVPKTSRNVFPVTDKEYHFLGLIYIDDLKELMFNKSISEKLMVKDVMHDSPALIETNEDLYDVMKRFDETGAWVLPVIKDKKFVGFISKTKIFNVYREQIKSFSIE
jgi:chloride channel protein, CIC family